MTEATHRKKAPPYTRKSAHNVGPDAQVFVGADAWERAAELEAAGVQRLYAVLPPVESANSFDWSAFRGREVRVTYRDPAATEAAAAVAVALIEAGAAMAVTIDHTGDDGMRGYRPTPAEWEARQA